MSWILPGDISDSLMQGGHEHLRVMGLLSVQRSGEGEGQEAVVIGGNVGSHAADAFKTVHTSAAENRNRRADDIAAMLGVSRVPAGPKACEPPAFTVKHRADHYALIAVISTFV